MTVSRDGSSVNKSMRVQKRPANEKGLLPWPLTVPWSGSFLTSKNPTRDFPEHGVYAGIEAHVVSMYRPAMVQGWTEIGMLRKSIADILGSYLADGKEYYYPDNIQTPQIITESSDPGSSSFLRYYSQVEEIIKFCAKQQVMLAHPGLNKDSASVRKSFEQFTMVSGMTGHLEAS